LLQTEELRSGGSYFSQNDLRLHFGLEHAKKVDMVEIRWLSGQVDQVKNLAVNQLHVIQEGGKILNSGPLPRFKMSGKLKA
jgi:pantothenate kinase